MELSSLAIEIQAEHELAVWNAEKAVDHAKRAGELLLRAKQKLPHGSFREWVKNHCAVSQRQAQRYMRAAKGLPTSAEMLILKNDTVSYFMPFRGHRMIALDMRDATWTIEPSAQGDKWVYLCRWDFTDDIIDTTRRPIDANFADRWIRHSERLGIPPAEMEWASNEHEGVHWAGQSFGLTKPPRGW